MLKGNKGEWGELYAFCYLLNSGVLHAADKDLNVLERVYFPIIKIIREEKSGQVFKYKPEEEIIKIYSSNILIKEISKTEFENTVSLLLQKIPQGSRAFEIPEVNNFFNNINCRKIKANSTQKQDITMQIHDLNTGYNPICGFSIKSYLGSNPTLINPGSNTNFVFTIQNCNDELMNEINSIASSPKIINRMNRLIESGCDFNHEEHLLSSQFEENLEFVDTLMPKFLSFTVLISYKYKLNSSKEIIDKLKELNPLGYSNLNIYDYKFKKFLCACALGMTPEKHWEGVEDANGGYIVVKKDGTVVCYHIYNRSDFEQYLFDYTYFERPSTSRYNYMSVYKEGNQFKLKLNLQVRFI